MPNDTSTATQEGPLLQSAAMADTAPRQTRQLPQAQRPQSPAAQARTPTLLELLKSDRVQDGLARVAGKLLDPVRLTSLVVNSIHKTPKLALCEPKSVLGAVMVSGSLGLEPNTPAGLAYLIPYKSRWKNPATNQWEDRYSCQFQLGYRGLITLAHRSKAVLLAKAEAIRDRDEFHYVEGFEAELRYIKALSGRGRLQGAFCFTRHPDGLNLASVIPLEDIYKARARSETYRALSRAVENARNDKELDSAEKALAETPWVMWEDQMVAKTAMKAHLTRLPIWDQPSALLASAAALDDSAIEGTLDMTAIGEAGLKNADNVLAMVKDEAPLPTKEPDPAPTGDGMDGWVPPDGEG